MTTLEIDADDQSARLLNPVAPRVAYAHLPPSRELPANILFGVTFGGAPPLAAPVAVRVNLEPQVGNGLVELWYANGSVNAARAGTIRHAADDHFLVGVIEVNEHEHGGIVAATEYAYRTIDGFQAASEFPHLLRTWNYLDAINQGAGDAERYRGFCSGRVAAFEGRSPAQYPAATVIGRRDGQYVLQVYWLAARLPGMALENPRQLPAYQYPPQYGRTSPIFSRAMLVSPDALMISGTASIVGHASRHPGSVVGQVDEILANLDSLLSRAHEHAPGLPAGFGFNTLIKAYVRNHGDVAVVESRLRAHLPAEMPLLVLLGDVCRGDLLVEFDCLHTSG